MPEIRASAYVPQPVNQELQLPIAFPPLPRVMVERFGAEAKEYEASLQQFWTRTRRVFADLRFDVTAPVNKVVKETKSVVEHMEEFDEGFIKISEEVRLGTAAILIEKQLREKADGYLEGMYTLRVVAGAVVTGMIITSADGPPDEQVSEIIFQTNVLKVQTATGPVVTLLRIAPTGIVFGADLSSDNFISGIGGQGWRLTRNTGILECYGGLFRGAIVATAGQIGGFTITEDNMEAQTSGNYVVMNSDPALGFIVGGWNGTAPTGSYAQLARFAGAFPSLKMDNNTGLTNHLSPDGLTFRSSDHSQINISSSQIAFFDWSAGLIATLFRHPTNALATGGNFLVGGLVQAASFNALSSIRFKENLRPLGDALDLVEQLQAFRFDWKDGRATDDIGLIAEEVGNIFPTIIGRDSKSRIDSLDYSKLTAVLVEAVKELAKRVDGLEHQSQRG